jgi:hypothetical protein
MELDTIKTEICNQYRKEIGSRPLEANDAHQIDRNIELSYLKEHDNPDHLWWIITHVKHTNESYDLLVEKVNSMMVEVAPQDQLARPIVDKFLYSLALVGLRLDIVAELNR